MENENKINTNIQASTDTRIPLPPNLVTGLSKKRKVVISVILFVIICGLAIWILYKMRTTAPVVAPVTIEQKIESIDQVHKMNEAQTLPTENEIVDIIKYNSQN